MLRIIFFCFITILLNSCATISPTPPTPAHLPTEVSAVNNWQVQGKIGVIANNNAGSANFVWLKRSQQYQITLSQALSLGTIHLDGQPGHVELTMNNGHRYTASYPEELLASVWGYHLPISYLNDWIRGLPVAGMPAKMQYDNAHRLQTLTQGQWQIDYLSYEQMGKIALPTRVWVSSPNLKVKIVIYEWKLIDTSPASQQNSAS
jgi:outer membrane lipoprotein LolB